MRKQKKLTQIGALVLALVLIINSCPYFSDTAKAAVKKSAMEKEIYNDNACRITFKVTSEWDTGMEGQFLLENLGTEPLEGWRFQVTFPHEITNLWDGEIKSHEGNVYVIQYPSWNTKIPAGGKAAVGFTGKKSGALQEPTDCILLGGREDVPEEDYTVSYQVTSDWKDAFNAELCITNHTSRDIEGWQLEFDYICDITSFWTARLLSHEGTHYTIRNDEWNSVIRAGGSIRLGFEAKHASGGGKEEPGRFVLTAVGPEDILESAEEDEEDNLIYDFTEEELAIDTDKDEIPDCYEEEVLKTDPKNPDTDGDGIPDGYEFLYLGNDPLVKDSNLDNDGDGLTDLEEYQLGSDPCEEDSDNDSLTDYDEVKKYHTDPNEEDTDGDGITDENELLLGFDPTKTDTDGDGIPDGDEKSEQSFTVTFDYDGEDFRGLDQVTIRGNFTKYAEDTTEIDNVYEGDWFSSDVVGLVGVPLEITTESKFD